MYLLSSITVNVIFAVSTAAIGHSHQLYHMKLTPVEARRGIRLKTLINFTEKLENPLVDPLVICLQQAMNLTNSMITDSGWSAPLVREALWGVSPLTCALLTDIPEEARSMVVTWPPSFYFRPQIQTIVQIVRLRATRQSAIASSLAYEAVIECWPTCGDHGQCWSRGRTIYWCTCSLGWTGMACNISLIPPFLRKLYVWMLMLSNISAFLSIYLATQCLRSSQCAMLQPFERSYHCIFWRFATRSATASPPRSLSTPLTSPNIGDVKKEVWHDLFRPDAGKRLVLTVGIVLLLANALFSALYHACDSDSICFVHDPTLKIRSPVKQLLVRLSGGGAIVPGTIQSLAYFRCLRESLVHKEKWYATDTGSKTYHGLQGVESVTDSKLTISADHIFPLPLRVHCANVARQLISLNAATVSVEYYSSLQSLEHVERPTLSSLYGSRFALLQQSDFLCAYITACYTILQTSHLPAILTIPLLSVVSCTIYSEIRETNPSSLSVRRLIAVIAGVMLAISIMGALYKMKFSDFHTRSAKQSTVNSYLVSRNSPSTHSVAFEMTTEPKNGVVNSASSSKKRCAEHRTHVEVTLSAEVTTASSTGSVERAHEVLLDVFESMFPQPLSAALALLLLILGAVSFALGSNSSLLGHYGLWHSVWHLASEALPGLMIHAVHGSSPLPVFNYFHARV